MARLLLPVLGLALSLAGLGCGTPPGQREQEALSSAAEVLVAALGPQPGPLAWAGFRDASGEASAATVALDEQVASALIRRGVPLVSVDTLGGAAWGGTETLPARLWQDAPADRVLAGRLETAGQWAYLRLFLVEAGTGRLVSQETERLAARHLERLMAAAAAGAGEAGPVQVELHRLGLRQEGGIPRSIDIGPQAALLAGDKLQVRFRVARDCQVWVMLFVSTGERHDVFAPQPAYSGRWLYGPAEDEWVTLDQVGQVYTLYVVAARQLNPDLGSDEIELWRRVDELVRLGQVDRYAGLEQVDRALAEQAVVRAAQAPAPLVVRDAAEVPRGQAEDFMLQEGLTVHSRAEVLSAPTGVIRAVSFEVR